MFAPRRKWRAAPGHAELKSSPGTGKSGKDGGATQSAPPPLRAPPGSSQRLWGRRNRRNTAVQGPAAASAAFPCNGARRAALQQLGVINGTPPLPPSLPAPAAHRGGGWTAAGRCLLRRLFLAARLRDGNTRTTSSSPSRRRHRVSFRPTSDLKVCFFLFFSPSRLLIRFSSAAEPKARPNTQSRGSFFGPGQKLNVLNETQPFVSSLRAAVGVFF